MLCLINTNISLFIQCHVEIYVADINDNDPVFSESSYTVSIPEDTSTGRVVITVNATDSDKGMLQELYIFCFCCKSNYN